MAITKKQLERFNQQALERRLRVNREYAEGIRPGPEKCSACSAVLEPEAFRFKASMLLTLCEGCVSYGWDKLAEHRAKKAWG